LESLLSGQFDTFSCFLNLNAGAGGTDAQDWAQMLYRMFTRWLDKNNYTYTVMDFTPGEEAGLKSATLKVTGTYAYGYLKNEIGVHRLVRISPFNANGKRQTSFAAVDVIPELTEDYKSITINPEDLKIDTYRASGSGGQHVNKTDSAVRITHLPTGLVAQSQASRSQGANKDTAMGMLKSRLIQLMEKEHKDKVEELRNNATDIAWGNQIRSYVFHPYKMVKDHRTNLETSNVDNVMDGDITPFIESNLRVKKAT
jgi:peptide chain release factor 2